MANAANVKVSEGRVFAISGGTASSLDISQVRVLAAANRPSPEMKASQSRVLVPVNQMSDIVVSQARVLAVARGRISNPHVRAWTFTMDNHDFYVLQLGTQETLVYDTLTEQWYNWGSDNSTVWKAARGLNWLAGQNFASTYGSDVIVGDDVNGAIYVLNPDAVQDDDNVNGAEQPHSFQRYAEAQVVIHGYAGVPCYGIQVLGSQSQLIDNSLTSVTLEYSDDRGVTYVSAGTIDLIQGDNDGRLFWRSLGNIKSPGRLFRITDYGALQRIDSMDMVDGQ